MDARGACPARECSSTEWNPRGCGFEAKRATAEGGDADGAGDVGADAEEGSSYFDKGAFAAATAAGAPGEVVGVEDAAKNVIIGVSGLGCSLAASSWRVEISTGVQTHHHGLRDIRLDVKYSS